MQRMRNWNWDSITDHLMVFIMTILLGLVCAFTDPLWVGVIITGLFWIWFCYPMIKRIVGRMEEVVDD